MHRVEKTAILGLIVLFLLGSSIAFTAETAQKTISQNLFEVGLMLQSSGKPNKAIETFTAAIKIDPEFAEAFYNRGLAYANIGNYDKAIEDYTAAVKIKPVYAEVYYGLGQAYEKSGNQQQADASYKKAAELGSKEAQDYLKSKSSK